MIKIIVGFFGALLVVVGGWLIVAPQKVSSPLTMHNAVDVPASHTTETKTTSAPSGSTKTSSSVTSTTNETTTSSAPATVSGQKVYSYTELLALADNKYADGNVPLGDYKYVTDGPKKGYIYLCNFHKDNPGSMVNGPWMGTNTWNFLQKISIQGSVSWSNAIFSNIISGTYRTLTGNDLPINHTTGTFPVASNDPAAAYDKNPNTISAQTLSQKLPVDPVYSNTPYCMGGEVGIMLSGVALFNGFDAGLRDAAAHELQDSCEGHPQGSGEYHYHSMSSCFKNIEVETVLGFAYDGFPITGPKVAEDKYLTTEDLDECHGITSEVVVDGKKKNTYHYVMTQDFPYSASCFRAKSNWSGPAGGGVPQGGGQGGMPPPPR